MPKLDPILNRKMTRQAFLGTLVLGLMTLIGLPSLLGILSGDNKKKAVAVDHGFGVGPYGGGQSSNI